MAYRKIAYHGQGDTTTDTTDENQAKLNEEHRLTELGKIQPQREAGTFLDTNKYPLLGNVSPILPEKVQNLRIKMLEHMKAQNDHEEEERTGTNPTQGKYIKGKVKTAAQAVTVAHDKAIGQHTFMEDGKNHQINIDKEGSPFSRVIDE